MPEISDYKNFLITLDTCAARVAFYEAINLLEKCYRIAPSTIEERQFLVAIPNQTIREQANIYGGAMMSHYLNKYSREDKDPSGLVRFWKTRRSPLSDIYWVETGYCSSFVEKLSTEYMPKFLNDFRKAEESIDRTKVRTSDWLKYSSEGAEVPKHRGIIRLKDKDHKFTDAKVREFLTVLYSEIAALMREIDDKKYREFRDDPRIMGNLRSPATLQILRDHKIWPESYKGERIGRLHRDCADFATLQMYTNRFKEEFPKSFKSWSYICVTKDTGLMQNLEMFRQSDPESKEITHPIYSRHKKDHKLTVRKKSKNMELYCMTPRDFYFFLVSQLIELTGIEAETFEQLETGKLPKSCNLSGHAEKLYNDTKAWRVKTLEQTKENEEFLELVEKLAKKIAEVGRDIGSNEVDSKTLSDKNFADFALRRTRSSLAQQGSGRS